MLGATTDLNPSLFTSNWLRIHPGRSIADRAQSGAALTPTLTPTSTTPQTEPTQETSATRASPDGTIATLRSQFKSLRTTHEAHVSSLAETHAAELASLQSYAKLLEQQLAQRPDLHHGTCYCISPPLHCTSSSRTSHSQIDVQRSSCSPPTTFHGVPTALATGNTRYRTLSGPRSRLAIQPFNGRL